MLTGRPAEHDFSRIPSVQIERAAFDRSSGLKANFNAGQLVPVFVDEVLPGDTFQLQVNAFGRLATLIRPIMDNLYLDWFFFFVPNRLVWSNWVRLNGEQIDPGDSTDFLVPQVVAPATVGFAEGSIYDFMGIPPGVPGLSVNALPFRAYNLVWNEWFRDQNLQDSVTVPKLDGPDLDTVYSILPRGKRHDYFTSCLPWPQKGQTVLLPLGTSAPVVPESLGASAPEFYMSGGATSHTLATGGSGAIPTATWQNPGTLTASQLMYWWDPNLVADLSAATGATINQLREAFAIQRLFERDARGGTRYTEVLRAHFGVVSPDARLQRPEFLGGGTTRISINPVAQTYHNAAAEGEETALGELGAFGTFGVNGIGFRQSFTEHGFVLGFCSLRADLNYQQGLDRMWSRRERFDYYWPALAHLGEQAVLNREIYAQGTPADDGVFGYQERFAEYRYKPSRVVNRLRSSSAAPLDSWHLAQDFSALPVLNASFIVENPPIDRVVAVTSELEAHALLDVWFKLKCARPMPLYGVPGLIDHF